MRKVAVLLMVSLAAAWAATAPLVQRMLPARDAVKGFAPVADSVQYGKGDDLTKIYNGGYELYTKNGVVDAARQLYQRKSDYVEVTIHTMKSKKTAADFLGYWQKQHKVVTLTRSGDSRSFLVTKPNVMSFSITGTYFATVSAFHAPEQAVADVRAFTSAVEKSIRKLAPKPPKGKN